jgi:hypothetical protein
VAACRAGGYPLVSSRGPGDADDMADMDAFVMAALQMIAAV